MRHQRERVRQRCCAIRVTGSTLYVLMRARTRLTLASWRASPYGGFSRAMLSAPAISFLGGEVMPEWTPTDAVRGRHRATNKQGSAAGSSTAPTHSMSACTHLCRAPLTSEFLLFAWAMASVGFLGSGSTSSSAVSDPSGSRASMSIVLQFLVAIVAMRVRVRARRVVCSS